MNSNSVISTFLFLIFGLSVSMAQVPTNPIGVNPHRLKWKQIDNDLVQVVFPQGQEEDGRRVADLIAYMAEQDNEDIGQLQQKVSIFLHGHRATANGLVTVGPFRSELFQTSPQMANSTDYLDLLTIHEYRHVQQFANATQGITKTVKHILGSWAWGGLMAMALPRWYFEGDAVIAETDHSASGRGRLPIFLMQYNALIDANKNYSYEKAGARSLKDYVPDWYPLGYHMLRYGRAQFGENIWKDVVSDAVRYKGLFTPFSRNLKKRTGLSTTDLYNATMQELAAKRKTSKINSEDYNSIFDQSYRTVSDYTNAIPVGQSLIYSKSAYDEWGAFYRRDNNGNTFKLTEHGLLTEGAFNFMAADNNNLYWAELGFDARWANQNWSDIYNYNLISGKKKRLTHKTRYFSPDINTSTSKLVVVEVTQNQETFLTILDANTGEKIDQVPNPGGYHIQHPRWMDDDIIAVFSKDEVSGIGRVRRSGGEVEWLTPRTSRQLTHPSVADNLVFYSASYTDANQIYVIDLGSNRILQVTSSAIGAFQPSYNAETKELYFSEFSADGMRLKSLSLALEQLDVIQLKDESKEHEFSDHHDSHLQDISEGDYNIKKYSKLSGLLNPHSLLADFDDNSAELSLRSDNKFSTMSAEARARYNYNEDRWTYGVGLNYAEFYPILNASLSKSYRSAEFWNYQEGPDTSIVVSNYIGLWSENTVAGGFTLPYNFSKGNMSNSARLRTRISRSSLSVEETLFGENSRSDTTSVEPEIINRLENLFDEPLQESSFTSLDILFSIQVIKRQALQNIDPRLGFFAFLRYRDRLNDLDFSSDVWTLGGQLYLPGFAKNHSFSVETSLQWENMLSPYRFGDSFNYPRGYNRSQRVDQFGKIGVNYSFPIAYPDFAIGGLAFIKRLKGELFYDHGWMKIDRLLVTDEFRNRSMRSMGFEFGIDFRALRLVEVDLGIRYSYLLDPVFTGGDRHQFDFFVISITE